MSLNSVDDNLHSDEDIFQDQTPYISQETVSQSNLSATFTRRPLRKHENGETSAIFSPGFGRFKFLNKATKSRYSGPYVSPVKDKSSSTPKNRKSWDALENNFNISLNSDRIENVDLTKFPEVVDLTDTIRNDKNKNDTCIDLTQSNDFFSKFKATSSESLSEIREEHNCEIPKEDSSDEDLIVVSTSGLQKSDLNYSDMYNTVDNMVRNICLLSSKAVENLTAKQIAKKMKNLYNTDFNDRMGDISDCLSQARLKYTQSVEQNLQVVPGIRASDLDTLNPGEWLNDVIINEYLKLLTESQPSAGYVSSFFYEELLRNKIAMLPEKWIYMKWLLIPFCIESHWTLLAANLHAHTTDMYNSLSPTKKEKEAATVVTICLQNYYNKVLSLTTTWHARYQVDLPKQENSYDCGVYICMFARKILYQLSSNIQSENVTKFREWIKKELINGSLSQ